MKRARRSSPHPLTPRDGRADPPPATVSCVARSDPCAPGQFGRLIDTGTPDGRLDPTLSAPLHPVGPCSGRLYRGQLRVRGVDRRLILAHQPPGCVEIAHRLPTRRSGSPGRAQPTLTWPGWCPGLKAGGLRWSGPLLAMAPPRSSWRGVLAGLRGDAQQRVPHLLRPWRRPRRSASHCTCASRRSADGWCWP